MTTSAKVISTAASEPASQLTGQCVPTSYRYHGTYDRTYIVWQADDGIWVSYYDHDDDSIGTPVRVGLVTDYYTNGVANDYHGGPIIIVMQTGDDAGRIVILHSHHSSPLMCRISNSVEDIGTSATDWTHSTVDAGDCDYITCFIRSDNDLWITYRLEDSPGGSYRARDLMRTGTISGTAITWSAATVLLDPDPTGKEIAYRYAAAYGDTFHLVYSCNTYPGSWVPSNWYHLFSEDGGDTWYTPDGVGGSTLLSLPATNATVYKVVTSDPAEVSSVVVYQDGTAACFGYYGSTQYAYGTYSDGSWIVTDCSVYGGLGIDALTYPAFHPQDTGQFITGASRYAWSSANSRFERQAYANANMVTADADCPNGGYNRWAGFTRNDTTHLVFVNDYICDFAGTMMFSAGTVVLVAVSLGYPMWSANIAFSASGYDSTQPDSANIEVTRNTYWRQYGDIITVQAPKGVRVSAAATVTSPGGGTMYFDGDASGKFAFSSDGINWDTSATVAAGTSNLYLSVVSVSGDTMLAAKVGVPV